MLFFNSQLRVMPTLLIDQKLKTKLESNIYFKVFISYESSVFNGWHTSGLYLPNIDYIIGCHFTGINAEFECKDSFKKIAKVPSYITKLKFVLFNRIIKRR